MTTSLLSVAPTTTCEDFILRTLAAFIGSFIGCGVFSLFVKLFDRNEQ